MLYQHILQRNIWIICLLLNKNGLQSSELCLYRYTSKRNLKCFFAECLSINFVYHTKYECLHNIYNLGLTWNYAQPLIRLIAGFAFDTFNLTHFRIFKLITFHTYFSIRIRIISEVSLTFFYR